jgi:ABC-type transporter lipoprotein component MlaA/pimeloyl-ACP methyl ester carboxylesterase
LNIQPAWKFRNSALIVWILCVSVSVRGQQPLANPALPQNAQTIVLPESVPDPLEPFNRAMWAFNKGFMTDVIKPTSKIYRAVVAKPVRTGIGNMGTNIIYPDRLINNLLQGKWVGARDETYRFLCNSTVGLAGFFDVASKWKIQKSDEDFGQSFGWWGWKPDFYLMLPFFGPSNDRDTLGMAADSAANPLLYIYPYKLKIADPLTYLGPYSYFSYAVQYNDLSDTVNQYVRFSQAEMDPYAEIQYAWTFARADLVADFHVKGKQDQASLETLESIFFTYKDPNFPNRDKTRSALIPTTGRKLKFSYWLQPGKAPVVYIVPGLGSHRMAEPSLALAELVYKSGFSAVCISSPFNSEFMEQASTAALPAYMPVDGHDLHVALTEIDRHLNKMYPGRLDGKALLGYSMGAFDSLYLASTESTNQSPLIKFDSYVAINTPVRLLHGVSKLDEFYRAPLEWPATERTENIENTFLKMAALSKSTLTPQTSLPFNDIESKFLIGMTFRFMLRDIIFSSQRRHNQGILRQPILNFRREPVYQEILQYSYHDYFERFAVPYYQARGMASPLDTLAKAGDLRTYESGLRANPKIHIIVNQDDFLLGDEDMNWLHATFTPQQLTVFPVGGHLGNLFNPSVQKTILRGLNVLIPSPPKSN